MMFQRQVSKTRMFRLTAHAAMIAFVVFGLVRRAAACLPGDLLFLLTSRAAENFVCALCAYLVHYVVIRSDRNWKKAAFALTLIILLLALAALKDQRIHSVISFEQTLEFFSNFLGRSLVFYAFVVLVGHLGSLQRYQALEEDLIKSRERVLRD